MSSRICRFHLDSSEQAIVEIHPQAAKDCQYGTIVIRFENWVGLEARKKIADAMNAAQINAHELSGRTPEA
jgi:hypothetical protein